VSGPDHIFFNIFNFCHFYISFFLQEPTGENEARIKSKPLGKNRPRSTRKRNRLLLNRNKRYIYIYSCVMCKCHVIFSRVELMCVCVQSMTTKLRNEDNNIINIHTNRVCQDRRATRTNYYFYDYSRNNKNNNRSSTAVKRKPGISTCLAVCTCILQK